MTEDYTHWVSEEVNFHDSAARLEITSDVRNINNSDLPRIVLSSTKGIKIASQEEYKKWSESKWISIKGMIKRLSYKDYKAGLDGQVRIQFNEDSQAKVVYDAFMNQKEDISVDELLAISRVIGKIEG
jgi:uncharacterized lipoprotein YehR (DUF1307 family)